MNIDQLILDSQALAEELSPLLDLPLFDDTERLRVSRLLCTLSLEHWAATRLLLADGFLPSAVIVHRGQFEAILRSIWVLYCASDSDVTRLGQADLTGASEQAAKNLLQTQEMMVELSKKGPPQAFDALHRFKSNSWKALNSYAHAGIHPVHRHGVEYPVELAVDVLKNTNGLAVVSYMQASALVGSQELQQAVLNVAEGFQHCLPPKLEPAI